MAPPGVPPPGMPPVPPPGVPPAGMEPPAKKQKTSDDMLSEDQFVASHGTSGTFMVKCPDDANNDKLSGQTITIEAALMSSVKDFKAKIAELTGLAVGSQKLKGEVGFLKDGWTLAKHNLVPGVTTLELGVQYRGGQR